MLLSRRIAFFGLVALAGCGFEPVHGTGGTAQGLRGTVQLDEPQNRNEFLLNEQMELRLGRSPDPRYGLAVTLDLRQEGLAITDSNDIERFNLVGEAAFQLREVGTKRVVLADKVNTFTAYSASQQPVATLAAERDARARLMVALADKIVAELLINADQF